ncbi:MAG: class I SAM-dependent methyltransferase [Rufibacter sp.]
MAQPEDWFSTWFDSEYYHILYRNHDAKEAQRFMDNLLAYLAPTPTCQLLDLACGKGRHSIYLNQKGFDVTGVDLSGRSIAHARQFENERLHFFRHDMRDVFRPNGFDVVLNLFTSFGYFKTDAENLQALQATAASLKPGGTLVIDFMNSTRVVERLVPQETKREDGISFHIERKAEKGFIFKYIRFQDQDEDYAFMERVRAFTHEEFLSFFRQANLQVKDVFGNYSLEPFAAQESERMIFVLKK